MTAHIPSSPTPFRRLRGLSALVLPWVLGALLLAGVAHAAHLHKPDAVGGTDTLHCGVCVQFDRLASAPSTAQLAPTPAFVTWVSLPRGTAHATKLLVRLYEARGPPRV